VLRLVLVLSLWGLSASAQTLTRPPTLLEKVEPATPDGGVTTTGTVVMEVDLGLDGKVLAVKVVSGLSPALDAAAVTALKQFVFTPAEIDNQPAAVRIQYALGPRLPLAWSEDAHVTRWGPGPSFLVRHRCCLARQHG
jgi:TonB family protein